jgi:hypothetical protein
MSNNVSIKGMTVYCKVKPENDYGKGTESFCCLGGEWPDPGMPFQDLDEVIVAGIDLHMRAWTSTLTARCATGILSGTEWKKKLKDAEERLTALRRALRKRNQEKVTQEQE